MKILISLTLAVSTSALAVTPRMAKPKPLVYGAYGSASKGVSLAFKLKRYQPFVTVIISNKSRRSFKIHTRYSCSGYLKPVILAGKNASTLTRKFKAGGDVDCGKNIPVETKTVPPKSTVTLRLPFKDARKIQQSKLQYFQLTAHLPTVKGQLTLTSAIGMKL